MVKLVVLHFLSYLFVFEEEVLKKIENYQTLCGDNGVCPLLVIEIRDQFWFWHNVEGC